MITERDIYVTLVVSALLLVVFLVGCLVAYMQYSVLQEQPSTVCHDSLDLVDAVDNRQSLLRAEIINTLGSESEIVDVILKLEQRITDLENAEAEKKSADTDPR